eukprot:TRINITY_DN2326_c0_g1_i1.p1 TRINITY_DN2326_c0_g1~~TRINITY_DN2326_c0_g1_i1.p1  ORF type:complete len:1010 (+),score=376.46 TRINITY_DN2326_c0_g1_i1:51-3080(+)
MDPPRAPAAASTVTSLADGQSGTLAPSTLTGASVSGASAAPGTGSLVSGVSAASGLPSAELALDQMGSTGPRPPMVLDVKHEEMALPDAHASSVGVSMSNATGRGAASHVSQEASDVQVSAMQPGFVAYASGKVTEAASTVPGSMAATATRHDDDESVGSDVEAEGAEPVFDFEADGDTQSVPSSKGGSARSFRRANANLQRPSQPQRGAPRRSIHGSQFLSQQMDDDMVSVYSAVSRADTEVGNMLSDLRIPEDGERRKVTRRPQAVKLRISDQDREKALTSSITKRLAGAPKERVDEEKSHTRRLDRGRKLLGAVLNEINTPFSLATASQQTPRYPRMVKPLPDLGDLVNYRPTQLELDWNKSMLGRIDWLSVGDIDLVNPDAYGAGVVAKPTLDARDMEMLKDSLPYDKTDSREPWKGKGTVPIFTVRPAYTEIGLRDTQKTTNLSLADQELLERRKVREMRESEADKEARFKSGIQETFETAALVDCQWLTILMQVTSSLGMALKKGDPFMAKLSDEDVKERFLLLRQQTITLAKHCTPAALAALDTTFLSVRPGATAAELEEDLVVPELRPAAATDEDQAAEAAEWREAWLMWAAMYASEMTDMGLTKEARDKKFRQTRPKMEKVLNLLVAAKIQDRRTELRHPENPRAALVSVKEVLVEDEEISQKRDLVVSHFESRDPLPVDRLVEDSVDFYELENAEQLRVRHNAPEELYEGGMLLWRRNLNDEISAEYVLPQHDPAMHEKTATLRGKDLIDASWNQGLTPNGQPSAMEYDSVSSFRGRLIHQRESHFVFRECGTKVKVAYPPRRLTLSYAPEATIAQNRQDMHELTRLRDEHSLMKRKNTKHIFNWEQNLLKWTKEEDERAAELEEELRARRRKRRAERGGDGGKRRRLQASVAVHMAERAAAAAEGDEAAAAAALADEIEMGGEGSQEGPSQEGPSQEEPSQEEPSQASAGDTVMPAAEADAPQVDLIGDALRAAGDASQPGGDVPMADDAAPADVEEA